MTKTSGFLLFLAFSALAAGQTLVPPASAKYKETRKVYDRLIRASGSAKTPPKLLMTAGMPPGRDPGLLALYNGDTVQFSEHVYDKCSTAKGSNADCLSVLLGHELAHFYEWHLWKEELKAVGALSDEYLNLHSAGSPEEIKKAAQRYAIESQADYAGGMLSFQAGFDPTTQAVTLLKSIYAEFQIADKEKALPADAHPYPQLQERIVIAQNTAKRLHNELYPVFETGIQLFLAGDYQSSAECFDYIGKTFTSREILNNAAAAYIMQALAEQANLALGYSYPVQIDFDTRLRPSRGMKGGDDALNEAEIRLENAIHLDPAYAPAVLNLGIVKSLWRAEADSLRLADKAYELAVASQRPEWQAQAAVLRGIIAARRGDKAKASEYFEAAIKSGSHIASINKQVLEGSQGEPAVMAARLSEVEQISQLKPIPPQKPNSFSHKVDIRPRTAYQSGLELRVYNGESWNGRALVDNGSRYLAFLLSTPPAYSGTSAQGIRLGSSKDDVIRAYKAPSRIYPARGGNYYLYTDPNLLIFINAEEKVGGWTLYNLAGMK